MFGQRHLNTGACCSKFFRRCRGRVVAGEKEDAGVELCPAKEAACGFEALPTSAKALQQLSRDTMQTLHCGLLA